MNLQRHQLLTIGEFIEKNNNISDWQLVNYIYSGTPYKGHLWIKDTSQQGTLFLSHFMLNDPSTKDTSIKKEKFAGPNGVKYRRVPLYMHACKYE